MSRVPPLRFIEPQLASLVDEPPEGKHWIHEIKHDGYRCQLLIERIVCVCLRATPRLTDRFLHRFAARVTNQRNWMVSVIQDRRSL
jgi:ATP-dependent DNA ligase